MTKRSKLASTVQSIRATAPLNSLAILPRLQRGADARSKVQTVHVPHLLYMGQRFSAAWVNLALASTYTSQ